MTKNLQLSVRFSEEDLDQIREIAHKNRMSPGAFIRSAAMFAVRNQMGFEELSKEFQEENSDSSQQDIKEAMDLCIELNKRLVKVAQSIEKSKKD